MASSSNQVVNANFENCSVEVAVLGAEGFERDPLRGIGDTTARVEGGDSNKGVALVTTEMLVGHLPSPFFKDELVQIRKDYRLLVGLHVKDSYPPNSPHDGLTVMLEVLLWCGLAANGLRSLKAIWS
ncbi:hypothetical protein Pint_33100 [Pistacia integerrima]|uniref:Uncharacterized protein n=1 Tax=Pistacia integerrima TaxID=434235 RepID=A0ACC0X6P1_9ROSI|nr:hypothetical protein Pint_33100 [Pistacia integerrima]